MLFLSAPYLLVSYTALLGVASSRLNLICSGYKRLIEDQELSCEHPP